MRVFVSSMRRGLEEERDQGAAMLQALGYEVVRFEDFGATPSTSRVACLSAVASSDVYVLILGPNYGERLADTGLAPTEEEFNAALATGKRILIFKKANVDYEDAQAAFISRVGDYATGRFWQEFDTPASLLPALVTAVRSVRLDPPEVRWRAIEPIEYNTIHGGSNSGASRQPQYTSVLEVHVIPVGPVSLQAASAREGATESLIQRLRHVRLVDAGAPMERVADPSGVHVRRPSDPTTDRSSLSGVTTNPYCGIRVGGDGVVSVYQALSGDFLGSLVSLAELARRLGIMIEAAIPSIPTDAQDVVVVGCLLDEGRTLLGDESRLGIRTSGAMSIGRANVVPLADRAVGRDELVGAPQVVALEVAARLSVELENRA